MSALTLLAALAATQHIECRFVDDDSLAATLDVVEADAGPTVNGFIWFADDARGKYKRFPLVNRPIATDFNSFVAFDALTGPDVNDALLAYADLGPDRHGFRPTRINLSVHIGEENLGAATTFDSAVVANASTPVSQAQLDACAFLPEAMDSCPVGQSLRHAVVCRASLSE